MDETQQEKKPMASKGQQQGKKGTPPGQYPMNTGNPPPKGVADKASMPAKDSGRDTKSKTIQGADKKIPTHNARIRNAQASSSKR
jgi:hypothetical protein